MMSHSSWALNGSLVKQHLVGDYVYYPDLFSVLGTSCNFDLLDFWYAVLCMQCNDANFMSYHLEQGFPKVLMSVNY